MRENFYCYGPAESICEFMPYHDLFFEWSVAIFSALVLGILFWYFVIPVIFDD